MINNNIFNILFKQINKNPLKSSLVVLIILIIIKTIMVDKAVSPWMQKEINLSAHKRGCHLITDEILKSLPEIKKYEMGILHIFLKHTSASLTLNENFDPDVQKDMEDSLNRIVPENNKLYRHTMEGKYK